MAITYNRDKRSGKTYAYETTYIWDKEKRQSRSKRTLIGRLDEATGEIVPTDGRGRKRSPNYLPEEDAMPAAVPELQAEVLRLRRENHTLREQIKKLKSKQGYGRTCQSCLNHPGTYGGTTTVFPANI